MVNELDQHSKAIGCDITFTHQNATYDRSQLSYLVGYLGLGLRVWGFDVVLVRVMVSIGVRLGVALVRGWGHGKFGFRVRVGLGLLLGLG